MLPVSPTDTGPNVSVSLDRAYLADWLGSFHWLSLFLFSQSAGGAYGVAIRVVSAHVDGYSLVGLARIDLPAVPFTSPFLACPCGFGLAGSEGVSQFRLPICPVRFPMAQLFGFLACPPCFVAALATVMVRGNLRGQFRAHGVPIRAPRSPNVASRFDAYGRLLLPASHRVVDAPVFLDTSLSIEV